MSEKTAIKVKIVFDYLVNPETAAIHWTFENTQGKIVASDTHFMKVGDTLNLDIDLTDVVKI